MKLQHHLVSVMFTWWLSEVCSCKNLCSLHFRSGNTNSQKGTYNTSYVPAELASSMFQIAVQDAVSYTQSTEWNGTTVHKCSDPKVYTSETTTIQVLFTFEVTQIMKQPLRNIQLPNAKSEQQS